MSQFVSAEFNTLVSQYLEAIKADYVAWGARDSMDEIQARIRAQMVAEFNSSLGVEWGTKYLKIVAKGGVHSFIVIKQDSKFAMGDVLKAASWAAPARNFARGNLFAGTVKPTWTGVV